MTAKFSLDKDKIKVLLLEGVHPNTVETFVPQVTPVWSISRPRSPKRS